MNPELKSIGDKRVLKFNCRNCRKDPSIMGTKACTREVIKQLEEHASIDKIILEGRYFREYKDEDLSCLKEFVNAMENSHYLLLQNLTSEKCIDCEEERESRVEDIWEKLETEPEKGIAALKQLREELEEESSRGSEKCKKCRKRFLEMGVKPTLEAIKSTELASRLGEEEDTLNPGTRPSFLRSKLKLNPPQDPDLVDAYEVEGTKVRIYRSKDKLDHLYFLVPPEYRLPPEKVEIVQEVRKKLLEENGSLEPELARSEIEKKSRKLIMETSLEHGLKMDKDEVENLSKSLAKFTAGLGIIETLLSDPQIQDIYVDAPIGENPIYVHHQNFEECLTNSYLTPENAQVLTSRFRSISGRPFSEADPTLDLNMEGVRITAIQKPLSPEGLALAIRRHKSTPWTLPLFVKKNFLSPEAAGLLSLLVDSQASLLITGSRGAGKTSLLGALMLELLPKYRVLCLEDTAELPVGKLRNLGYRAQRLQVEPSISGSEVEMSAEEALRTALRLGESVLIIGEVRGPETKSLYEAMRVGAAGNSVMGTIHGSTTKDVFERVVYDLGIPPSSFKATDAIVVASPIRSKGSINRIRRLTQISEVRDDWKEDPISEGGFADLVTYDPDEDSHESTETLERGESSLLKSIGKKWSMSVSEIKENLGVRTKIQSQLVETASERGDPELLEAGSIVKSNLTFHRLLEEELQDGGVDYDRIYSRWEDWLQEFKT